MNQLIELTEDVPFPNPRPDGIWSRRSARPIDRSVWKSQRDLDSLYRSCHLSEVEIGVAIREQCGIVGLGDPIDHLFAEEEVLTGVEGTGAEGIEAVVSAEHLAPEFDEALEVALELDVLGVQRQATEAKAVEAVVAARGGVHAVGAVHSKEPIDCDVETVSSTHHADDLCSVDGGVLDVVGAEVGGMCVC